MITVFATELRLIARGGFWAAYAVVCAAYVGLLWALPAPLFDRVLPILLFSDPAVLGLWVVGAMVLLERREGALQAWAHTPARPSTWVAAKVFGITMLAVVVALVVAVGSGGLVRTDYLLLAVVPTSVLCVLLGIGIVSWVTTFNGFLALASAVTAPLALPCVEWMLGTTHPGLRWLPTGATAELIDGALGAPLSAVAVARDVGLLVGACGLAAAWTLGRTERVLWRRA